MSTLSQLRFRIEQHLSDSVEKRWSSTSLDEALRSALEMYVDINPRLLVTTITLASDSREIDVSGVSGLLLVREVWLPYTAASPEDPPNRRRFEFWVDSDLVRITDDPEPLTDEVARLFYEAAHTIEDLDSAASTTLVSRDEGVVVAGSVSFAVKSKVAALLRSGGRVDAKVASALSDWAGNYRDDFIERLNQVAARVALTGWSHIELPPLDRWDRDGGGWS